MNYIQFRIQIAPVIAYIIIPPGLLTSFLLSVNVTYYLIGTIIIGGLVFSFIESKFAKCPKCKRKPIPFLGEVPKKCPYCDENLID